MEKILSLISALCIIFFISGCGNKVDDDALDNLVEGLVKRWDYSDTLNNEITKDELLKAIDIELDNLEDYNIDDFKDSVLYSRLSNYRSELELIRTRLDSLEITDDKFTDEWERHLELRAMYLHEINLSHELDIPQNHQDNFKDVLSKSDRLVEINEIKSELSKKSHLEDIDVDVSDKSILIKFPTESVLSVDSFVTHKIGFPSHVMDFIKLLKKYDYDEIVVTTTNNNTVAISMLFEKDDVTRINFDKWEELDSVEAYEIYDMSSAYHIRLGIWEELSSETKNLLGDMNKRSENEFWLEYGFIN